VEKHSEDDLHISKPVKVYF